MCDLCEKARNMPEYLSLLSRMQEEDNARLAASMEFAPEMRLLGNKLYTSVKWPVKLAYPMFDARAAFSVPNNYYQNLYLDGERQGVMFAHGTMRSVFFSGERLMIFSTSVSHYHEKDFVTSFVVLHLEPAEYEYSRAADGTLTLSADITKAMKNIITGNTEKKKILFNFIHKPVNGRIVTKEKVLTSSQFRNVYAKYGGAQLRSASMDIEGYAITVPHFAPHPFMLQLYEKFGYVSKRDFQERTIDYFKSHLKPPFGEASAGIL
ncbi:hypothetical protein H0O02_00770 [Candidatus Micrarchaeota archaeon]|nr:hypothetical protein [Candidatus Micrarchaeota archaeon]